MLSRSRCLLSALSCPQKVDVTWFTKAPRHVRRINTVDSSIVEEFRTYSGGSVDLDKDKSNGVAVITLNNPDRKNSLTGKMMADMWDIVRDLEAWDEARAVILRGTAGTFCSGGDLTTVSQICVPDKGFKMACMIHNLLTRLHDLPVVSAALIEGHALGGGAELATACDFRIMTKDAKIGFVQTRMGVTTGWGGGTRLVHLVGRTNALKILLSGNVLDSTSATSCGLVDHIINSSSEPLVGAKSWLLGFCKGDAQASKTMKRIVAHCVNSSMENSLSFEREQFRTVWGGPAQLRALQKNIKHS